MEHEKRQEVFKRNERLEDLLNELNGVLGGAESRMDLPKEPRFPVVFVIGAPRSGTTLLMQWLAATGLFAVPSNLLSRFYGTPYLGGRIQRLLTDPAFNYKDELGDPEQQAVAYESHIGKTKGMLQPNEFWYFWRRFIPNVDPEWITPEQEARIDTAGFRAGVAAIEAAFDRPLATKGIILQYNLAALQRIFPKVLFIHTHRHPFFNIQSLLKARQQYFGEERTWFSVKPKEYQQLKDLDPVQQVAGQVYHTQVGIEVELAGMPRNALSIAHEDFCSDPAAFYARLKERLAALGHQIPETYTGPARFGVHDKVLVDAARRQAILAAWRAHAGTDPQLPITD
ncbi:MAG: sulfotransferase [Flavobacteriales bacterium]|nr:sulfotransferase [Flavobacteriales bacterium]